MSNFGYSMPSYFQNMPQIGKAVATPKADNVKAIKDVEEAIKARIDEVQAAGRSDESLNASGQMTALQRIDLLVDEGTWCPLCSLYNPAHNKDGSTGVIIGLGKINDKWAVVIASDNKKLPGAWVGGQALKLTRATDIA